MINDLRRILYRLARGLGDINALMKGKILSRLFNKMLGRKLISKTWARGSGCGCVLPLIIATSLALLCSLILH